MTPREPAPAPAARPRAILPPHASGMRIGLFGGSFNPPHEGHLNASLIALRRLRLDAVWLLVSPGNPLKNHRELAPLEQRLAAARRLAGRAPIRVSAIEAAIGSAFSFETLRYLRRRCPGVRFVSIIGADNLRSLHRWRRWRDILALAPIAVVDRPGSTLDALASRAGHALAPFRLPESEAARLPFARPPAFVFLHGRRSPASSTALRVAARAQRGAR